MTRKKNTVHFETRLKEINDIVNRMEAGDMSLEDSLKAFEQGLKLTRECQQSLEKAEQKVEKLIEKNGDLMLESFDTDEGDDFEDDDFEDDELDDNDEDEDYDD